MRKPTLQWQQIWSNCVNNKLYAIYQTVGTVGHNKSLSRHETVIINRNLCGSPTVTYYWVTINQTAHSLTHPNLFAFMLINPVTEAMN